MRNEILKFCVSCDNKGSFGICLVDPSNLYGKLGKPALLVRADRLDQEDNDRGHKLAVKVADFLNATLSQAEIRDLVQDEAIPPLS